MNAITPLTPEQRAAVVFVSLEPEMADDMAQRLGPDAVRRVREALQSLSHVPRQDLLGAFAMFLAELEQRRGGLIAGEARAANLLRSVLSPQSYSAALGVVKPVKKTDNASVWSQVEDLDADLIADFMVRNDAAVGSIVLSRLSGQMVSEILGILPQGLAVKLIAMMARDSDPKPVAVKVVEDMISEELLTSATDLSNDPKLIQVGEMLGTLDRGRRDAALEAIGQSDAARADVVRAKMLSFDDIPSRLPTRSVQVIFRNIDDAIVTAGLKAAGTLAPDAAEFLLSNITQRMSDKIREDIDAVPDQTEKAQGKAIAALLREILRLNSEGEIALTSPTDMPSV